MDSTITTEQVAEILGWSRAKVKREAKNGGIPTLMKLPRKTGAYLYDRRAIEFYARTQQAS